MFTGIIECMGLVKSLEPDQDNLHCWISSPISDALSIDQSVSHHGICLTVDERIPGCHRITAVAETLQKTNMASWQTGQFVNLERCLVLNGRLDGHMVQGHVDTTAICIMRTEKNGSWLFRFQFPGSFAPLIIEKGSVAINGTSLTCFDVTRDEFSVAIIPYTFAHTHFQYLQVNDAVNIEFDIIGKYLQRSRELNP